MRKVTSTYSLQAYTRLADNDLPEGKATMNAYSVLTMLLHPTNVEATSVQVEKPMLLPRTAADELPPYRDQPWIIDRCGYRKIDANLTFVPVSRL